MEVCLATALFLLRQRARYKRKRSNRPLKETTKSSGSCNKRSVHIICVGHATIDTILRVERVALPPSKIMAKECVQCAGGMATNAAAAAARLGAAVSLYSAIGDDAAGVQYLADLHAESGLDLSGVQIIKGARTCVSSILVDADGERLVCPFTDPALHLGGTAAVCKAMQMCLDTSTSQVQACLADVRWPQAAVEAMQMARRRGIKIAVLDADVAKQELLRTLAPLATHVIFSEQGLACFAGATKTEEAEASLERVTQQLFQAQSFLRGTVIGVTVGSRGFIWLEGSNPSSAPVRLRQSFPPSVTASDTLAAGDVFHAAFTVALARGFTVADAAEYACVAAALKCSVFGGRLGAPTEKQMEDFKLHR